ncbi:MAG TPA: TonB-dependent receptor [Bryobacteraceae bacterium]
MALALFTVPALAQSDRGTITGTIVDSSGAVVPGAKVVLSNSGTGVRQETSTTATGNYAIASLPAGRYTLSVEQPGFGRYEQSNIQIMVAETTRVDVTLKVGQATESVEVYADATMLKTETAEQSSSIAGDTINTLPMNYGIGAGAVRNPLSFVQLTPGAMMTGWNTINVNGLPAGSFRILFEGQESNNGLDGRASDEVQPSVDAVQQFTLQTSNFAAEFGQVAGGLFNFTARSGTNQIHGGGYLYATNEALNAGIPYTNDGKGHHNRPFERRFDGGLSFGGPVYIPKVYDGRNRTFFFFNYEKYRDRSQTSMGMGTVPTDAFRAGDFSSILTNRNLGTDFAGRAILENMIYDPATTITDSSGRYVLNPFPGNVIPQSRIDPVAAKMLNYIPKAVVAAAIANNYPLVTPFHKVQDLPSVKIDENLTSTARVSFYYAKQITDKDVGQDGFPDPISIRRALHIQGTNARINFDNTLGPHLLLHMGAGVQRYVNPDSSPEVNTSFDEAGLLGIVGAPGTGFPRLSGVGNNSWGGLSQSPSATSTGFGPANRGAYYGTKPTGLTQLTWVHGNHTYKTGGEWKIDAFTNYSAIGLSPALGFSTAQTAQPLYGGVIPGGTTIGNAFASFLLGYYNSASISNVSAPQYRKSAWALFLQDTWKVTRKLTLDYGLRWDLQKPMRELNARTSGFSRSVANPAANGLMGGVIYEGNGAGRCNCDLVNTYPFAIGPRIGVAYQMNDKTVIRAGWGVVYSFTNTFSYIGGGNSQGMGFNTLNFPSPGNGLPAGKMSSGLTYNSNDLYGAAYNPGLLVSTTGTNNAPSVIDPNGGRPPRVMQWNLSIQREISKDLVAEGAYVGNRGAWVLANNLVAYNTVNPATLSAMGLDVTNPTVRNLLTSSITSSTAVAAGFKKPYANFPDTGSVIQSLRPFPQYGSIGTIWAPLGDTWYDSVQAKITKRYSHGLDFSASYAYSKNLDSWEGNGNVFSRSTFKSLASSSQPHILTISVNYRLPAYGFASKNKYARKVLADWTIGSVLQYASGTLIAAPTSNNALGTYLPGQSTRMFRVPGQPLYLKDPNCGCYDPTKETILNPAAWTDTAPGVWGTAAVYYNDFRGQRRPSESMSIGKAFPIRERVIIRVRGEFFNIFNRNVSLPNVATGGPGLAPATYSNGLLTGGFGFVNYTAITTNNSNNSYPAPRAGQVVLRFEF